MGNDISFPGDISANCKYSNHYIMFTNNQAKLIKIIFFN